MYNCGCSSLTYALNLANFDLGFHCLQPLPTITAAKSVYLHSHLLLLMEERIIGCQRKRRAHSGPASSYNRGILHSNPEIPSQMPQSVHTVKEEWQSNGKLGRSFCPHRPCRNGSNYGRALEMPAKRRRCEVCEAKQIEATTQDDTSNSVETRGVPGDLGSIDGHMRGDRAC